MRWGVDPEQLGQSMTPQELNRWEALDHVTPLDHTEQMLGLIATLVGAQCGATGLDEVCTPWVDNSPAAIMARVSERR